MAKGELSRDFNPSFFCSYYYVTERRGKKMGNGLLVFDILFQMAFKTQEICSRTN